MLNALNPHVSFEAYLKVAAQSGSLLDSIDRGTVQGLIQRYTYLEGEVLRHDREPIYESIQNIVGIFGLTEATSKEMENGNLIVLPQSLSRIPNASVAGLFYERLRMISIDDSYLTDGII